MELKLPKSFVDVLFIMLLGAVVLLSESVRLGEVDAAPAEIGGEGVSAVLADDVRAVVVGKTDVQLEGGERFERVEALADHLPSGGAAVLMPGDAAVTHHRVMQVWSELVAMDYPVKLGAVEVTVERPR